MEGQALYINPAGLEMTGHAGEDPTTLSIADLQPPDSFRIVAEEAIPTAMERGTWTGELEFLHADGTPIPVSQVVIAIWDNEGNPVANATVARDIRERRLVEADVSQVVALMVEQAASSAEVAEQAASSALEGDQAVRETVAAMESIRDNTQETARRIKRLGEASQEISEVVRLIEELADRTTVLALNASIQAAAAGEAGRGFAVVAEEVQRLAERATGETRRIEDLVKTIQAETNEAAVGIEEATREVVEGSQLAQQAGERMDELNRLVADLANLIQHVADTTAQQTTASLAALAGGRPAVQAQPDGDGYAGPDGDGVLAPSALAGDGTANT
jgi:PAS domain S-box-containing protein